MFRPVLDTRWQEWLQLVAEQLRQKLNSRQHLFGNYKQLVQTMKTIDDQPRNYSTTCEIQLHYMSGETDHLTT